MNLRDRSRTPFFLRLAPLGLAAALLGAAPGCSSDDDSDMTTDTAGSGGAAAAGQGGAGGQAAGTGGAGTTGGAGGSTAGAGGDTAGGAGGQAAGAGGTGGGTTGASYLYVESNDPAGNAVLAFQRAADGSLTALPGGSFPTGGQGIGNPTQRLGPADSDQTFAVSPEGRLYAVNSGSATIAVFDVNADGSLKAIAGSPFASGGNNPVSLALRDQKLYVVNKEADGAAEPSYVALAIGADGSLSSLGAEATVHLPVGASPTQAYLAPGKSLLFGTRFLDASRTDKFAAGQLDAFAIGASGGLTAAAGAPFALPADPAHAMAPPAALDLIGHPTQDILYVGFPTRQEVGVFTYDASGALTFVKAAPNSGMAICWLRTTADGKRLYTVNSGSSTVSLYDLSDPMTPVESSHLELKGDSSGMPFTDAMGKPGTLTNNPFQFELDPAEKHLYVVSQRVTTNAADTSGNVLHTLDIAADGSLGEPGAPLDLAALGVPPTARPQGVVIISR
jgi:hypothetical protein